MAKRIKKSIHNEKGFTLMEVMIALMLFSVFITAILLSQSTNVNNSIIMAEDLTMHNLAELKMNEIMIDPPEFTNATESDIETKNFEETDYKDYKYTIKFTKIEFPSFKDLIGQSEDEDASKDDAIKKLIFDKLKKNLEEMMWQVKVTISNPSKDDKYTYELNGWLTNTKAKVDTNFSF